MTPQSLSKLASLLNDEEFIYELRAARPALDESQWQQAAGWESCVNYIIRMAEGPEVSEASLARKFINISKL